MNILLVLGITWFATSLSAQNTGVVTEKISLLNCEPSYVPQLLSPAEGTNRSFVTGMPVGIRSAKPIDSDMAIVAIGTPDAIAELKARLQLLDIRPKKLRLHARILHTITGPDGILEVQTRSEVTFTSYNNTHTFLEIPDWSRTLTLMVVPRINGDDSVSIAVEM